MPVPFEITNYDCYFFKQSYSHTPVTKTSACNQAPKRLQTGNGKLPPRTEKKRKRLLAAPPTVLSVTRNYTCRSMCITSNLVPSRHAPHIFLKILRRNQFKILRKERGGHGHVTVFEWLSMQLLDAYSELYILRLLWMKRTAQH